MFDALVCGFFLFLLIVIIFGAAPTPEQAQARLRESAAKAQGFKPSTRHRELLSWKDTSSAWSNPDGHLVAYRGGIADAERFPIARLTRYIKPVLPGGCQVGFLIKPLNMPGGAKAEYMLMKYRGVRGPNDLDTALMRAWTLYQEYQEPVSQGGTTWQCQSSE